LAAFGGGVSSQAATSAVALLALQTALDGSSAVTITACRPACSIAPAIEFAAAVRWSKSADPRPPESRGARFSGGASATAAAAGVPLREKSLLTPTSVPFDGLGVGVLSGGGGASNAWMPARAAVDDAGPQLIPLRNHIGQRGDVVRHAEDQRAGRHAHDLLHDRSAVAERRDEAGYVVVGALFPRVGTDSFPAPHRHSAG